MYVRRNLTTVKKNNYDRSRTFSISKTFLTSRLTGERISTRESAEFMAKRYHNDDQENWLEEQTESKAFGKPEKDSHDWRQEDDGTNIDWEGAWMMMRKVTKGFLLFDKLELWDITQNWTDSVN